MSFKDHAIVFLTGVLAYMLAHLTGTISGSLIVGMLAGYGVGIYVSYLALNAAIEKVSKDKQ